MAPAPVEQTSNSTRSLQTPTFNIRARPRPHTDEQMSLLVDLPNELLWRIFHHLSNADIDTLHGIAEVRHRIKGQFCLVTDSRSKRRFKRIVPAFHFDEDDIVEKLRGRVRIVLEVHYLPHVAESIDRMLSPGLNIHVSVFDSDIETWIFMGSSDLSSLVNLTSQDSGLKFVTVEEAREFMLDEVTLRSDRFAAPKLEKLMSIEVHLVLGEGDSRILFPNLEEILVEEEYACFEECLDWSRMRVLRMERVIDNYCVNGRNLVAPSLTELTMKGTHCGELMNLDLPNLRYLVIHQTAHDLLISDVELPSLTSMVVLTSFAVSIVNLNAPDILLFVLHASEVLKLQNVNLPVRENTHLSFDVMPDCENDDIDFSFLRNLKEFTVETHNSELLRFTPELEGLSIMTETFFQDSYDLPKLKTIRVELHSVEISSLLPFKNVALESLKMHNLDTSVEDIETIGEWWGCTLKQVDIRHYFDTVIQDWRFPELEMLTLYTGPSFEGLVECSFPKLKALIAYQEEAYARRPADSRWQIDAPELRKMSLIGYRIPVLDVTEYEKLDELEVNTVVSMLGETERQFKILKVNRK